MARRRSRFLLGLLGIAALATPAFAEDYTTNYLSHADTITLGAGDAPRANLAIQHPTPWPPYVNNTRFLTPAAQSVGAFEKMLQRYIPNNTSAPPAPSAASNGASN